MKCRSRLNIYPSTKLKPRGVLNKDSSKFIESKTPEYFDSSETREILANDMTRCSGDVASSCVDNTNYISCVKKVVTEFDLSSDHSRQCLKRRVKVLSQETFDQSVRSESTSCVFCSMAATATSNFVINSTYSNNDSTKIHSVQMPNLSQAAKTDVETSNRTVLKLKQNGCNQQRGVQEEEFSTETSALKMEDRKCPVFNLSQTVETRNFDGETTSSRHKWKKTSGGSFVLVGGRGGKGWAGSVECSVILKLLLTLTVMIAGCSAVFAQDSSDDMPHQE